MLSFWDLSQIESLPLAANGLGWEGVPPDGVPGTSQTNPVLACDGKGGGGIAMGQSGTCSRP